MKNLLSQVKSHQRIVKIFIFISFLSVFVFQGQATTHAKQTRKPISVLPVVEEAREFYEKITDYTCVLLKQERIDGKLRDMETILLKFRKPNDIYMGWIEKPFKGQELLYSPDRNKGKINAHKGGFLSAIDINVDPRGKIAMDGQHHTIYDAGLGATLNMIMRGLVKAKEENVLETYLIDEETLGDKNCMVIEALFPKRPVGVTHTVKKGESVWDIAETYNQDMYIITYVNEGVDGPLDIREGQQILVPHHYGSRILVWVDKVTKLPIKVEVYDWNGNLYEMYHYSSLKLNPGLTRMDFDPENPDYDF